jgi:hypothetical protein
LLYRGGAPAAIAVEEGVRPLATLVDDFAATVEARRDTAADVAAWLNTLAAVEDVRRSLAAGDAVGREVA